MRTRTRTRSHLAIVPVSSVEGCNRCICRSYRPAFAWHGRNLATSQSQMVSHDAATIVTSTTTQRMSTKGKPSKARSSTTTTKMTPARLYRQWSSRAHQLVCISRIAYLYCLLSFPVLQRMRSFCTGAFTRYRPVPRLKTEAEAAQRRGLCYARSGGKEPLNVPRPLLRLLKRVGRAVIWTFTTSCVDKNDRTSCRTCRPARLTYSTDQTKMNVSWAL